MQEVFFFFDARKETPLSFSFSRLTDGCLSLCVSTLASCALRSRADKDCIFQEAGCEFFWSGVCGKGFVDGQMSRGLLERGCSGHETIDWRPSGVRGGTLKDRCRVHVAPWSRRRLARLAYGMQSCRPFARSTWTRTVRISNPARRGGNSEDYFFFVIFFFIFSPFLFQVSLNFSIVWWIAELAARFRNVPPPADIYHMYTYIYNISFL